MPAQTFFFHPAVKVAENFGGYGTRAIAGLRLGAHVAVFLRDDVLEGVLVVTHRVSEDNLFFSGYHNMSPGQGLDFWRDLRRAGAVSI